MAPSPEYDKEPKAPDKSGTNISCEDTKLLHNLINDQHNSSDHKTTNSATNSEVENTKHVETLDDDKLRALLNEALTYKCPKDREGKSSLFKELLQEVEADEQEACSAAARTVSVCRGGRRARGPRGALPHSNSLQDLVAALAAEPAPRRATRHHAHAHHTVAARAIHGGSLPSGVDTSSLLSEEGSVRCGGAGYLATVRCVNPPPLAERRVSASDANAPHDLELLNRRSKPMFPMTYTARATLEIGSGSVCSGRAVTTTTASNQVRRSLSPAPAARAPPSPAPALAPAQSRLMAAICSSMRDAGGGAAAPPGKGPRGPPPPPPSPRRGSQMFHHKVAAWYEGLATYSRPREPHARNDRASHGLWDEAPVPPSREESVGAPYATNVDLISGEACGERSNDDSLYANVYRPGRGRSDKTCRVGRSDVSGSRKSDISLRKTYRERVLPKTLPIVPPINPKNIRSMSIGKPLPFFENVDSQMVSKDATYDKADHKSDNVTADEVTSDPIIDSDVKEISCNDIKTNDTRLEIENEISESMEDQTWKCFQMSHISPPPADNATGGTDAHALNPSSDNYDIELEEIVCHSATKDNRDTFSDYLADQEKLFQVLEATQSKATEDEYSVKVLENNNNIKSSKHSDDVEPLRKAAHDVSSENDVNMSTNIEKEAITRERMPCEPDGRGELVVRVRAERAAGDRYVVAELPNNAYLFLTLPSRLLAPLARDYRRDRTSCSAKRKDTIDKNALRVLLFENLLKSDRGSPPPGRASSAADKEVDSAIPFSCITTPEVVASCNTTPSASHAAVAVDPKPLQLAAEYRAVTSLAGPSPATVHKDPDEQPRSVIASSFNGLPLSRPHYASAASSDEYKKSLDENGNSVQGYSSPLSGSSQHKKPRRKKSSRNETVIDCRQLDGYQGDKDVNELLRFIESAEQRAPKLRKHKDDADDKGKKRSAERRKDKEHKPARAASLDELSRCREPPRAPPAKPERRSWGDAEPAVPDAPPDLGFQTVTKKRRARRRAEEAPRRPRAGAAARRLECARSDRSNDSTDDMDSVHSLPPPAPHAAPAPHASYADIARTRHNIPDLIESCNFYAEGEGEERRRAEAGTAAPPDAYPALEPPPDTELAPAPAPAPPDRKEPPPAEEAPAPDVVADRRPPVILLDSAARPRDLDGVTFGFDINEQLLGGGARPPRCDLLREAEDAPPAPPVPHAVPVRLAKRTLHYVPPPPPPDRAHLLRVVDYIGGAWEEAVRCGEGKVRYYSG